MDWTREELSGAVAAYVEMLDLERRGLKFVKKRYYESLSAQFNRSPNAFERRMQNISYVYSILGRQWLKGLKPAEHVGVNVSGIIEELISEHEGTFSSPKVAFHEQIAALRRSPDLQIPAGVERPEQQRQASTVYSRDPSVVAWVLNNSDGKCEVCNDKAPFAKQNGHFYLEVHHLLRLADGGSDRISNAVAACPNCHRELHFGKRRQELLDRLFENVDRLRRE